MSEETFKAELYRRMLELKALLPCCPNCAQWDPAREGCHMTTPPVRPPADVIAFGCPAYDQAIPF